MRGGASTTRRAYGRVRHDPLTSRETTPRPSPTRSGAALDTIGVDLIVLAKEPVAGRVKTRLCPPCTPTTAAALAAAALADTLAAGCASGADRVVLALDGEPGDWCPPGVTVVDQGTGSLASRLTAAWQHARGPALLIGMDTPQL